MKIIDAAKKSGQFSTLVKIIEQAGLTATINNQGPFTIFAPTDAAFSKFPKQLLEKLMLPENNEHLISVLAHHVVFGQHEADEIAKMSELQTVEGSNARIEANAQNIKVDAANVTQSDIIADNGVIHAIDAVIVPESAGSILN
ncbi:MAG: fasciclin domain-containing protein [Pseudomonadota bacterium]